MEVAELVRACQVDLPNGGELGAAQEMPLKRRVEILATPGVTAGPATCAVNAEDADSEHSPDLLETLFEHACISEENRAHHGDRFPNKPETLNEALVLLDGVDPPDIHGMRIVYARAEVDARPALAVRLIRHIGALRKSDRLAYDPDTEIDRLQTFLAAAAHTLHQVLDERIGAYPAVTRAAFTYDVACREEEVCGRIAIYRVLDLSAQVCLAAPHGFRDQTKLDVDFPDVRRRGLSAPLPDLTRRPFVSALISNNAVQCFHGHSRYETQLSQDPLRTLAQGICTLATKLNSHRLRLFFGMIFPCDSHRHGALLFNSDGSSVVVPPRLDPCHPLPSVCTKTPHVPNCTPTPFWHYSTNSTSQMP